MSCNTTTLQGNKLESATLILCQDEHDENFIEVLRDKLNDPYPDTQIICLHSNHDEEFLNQMDGFKDIDPSFVPIQIQNDWDGVKLSEVLKNNISGDKVFWIRGDYSVYSKIVGGAYSVYGQVGQKKILSIGTDEHVDDYLDKEDVDILPTPLPKIVGLHLTTQCNYKCFFCNDEKERVELPIEDFYKFEPLIENAEIISITGVGEFLTYKYIKEAIEFINEHNDKNCINVNTNGSLLTEEFAILLSKNLDLISISLNAATKETYERDMKNGNWDKVINNIRTARKHIPGERMKLHFVAHGGNIKEFPDLVMLANELGVGKVEMKNLLVMKPEYLGESLWFHKEQTNAMVGIARSMGKQFDIEVIARNFDDDEEYKSGSSHCEYPFNQVFIIVCGEVYPCCFASQVMGNVYIAGGFEKVWSGKKYRRLRKERYFPECKRCGFVNPWNKFESHLHPVFYKSSNVDSNPVKKSLAEMLEEWKKLQDIDDDEFVQVLLKIGEEFSIDGQDADRAIEIFSKAIDIRCDCADAHNNLGVVHFQQSNHQLALKHLGKAVSLGPEKRLFATNYGRLLEFLGRASEPSDLDSDFVKGHAGDDKRGEALSLRTEYLPFGKPNFSDEEIEAVSRTMRAGWVGMGQETIKFEEELSSYLDVPHVVTVNSCTSALFLSLLIHGIGPGDEIICPSLTWCSTANAALYLGARPVFCDVDPDTLCITSESVSEKLTERTRAVIVVHFGGLAADVERIRSILPPDVVIVEDAAHALGTKFPNAKAVATSGNLTCFSFYANKNLSTAEGGAIALFDDEKAEHLRSLRQHALASNAWNRFVQPKSMIYSTLTELGYKMNYTDLQAAIGRVQLKRQPEFHARRLEIADLYYQELSRLEPQLRFQHNVTHPYHARHLFTVVLPVDKMTATRDEFLLRLRSMNIGASIHYAPLHTMPLYASASRYELIHTERIGESILTLPISAGMSLDDARYVTDKFIELFNASIEHEDQFCGTADLHEESRVRDKVRLL